VTAEQLAEIEALFNEMCRSAERFGTPPGWCALAAGQALLAEVRRLQALEEKDGPSAPEDKK